MGRRYKHLDIERENILRNMEAHVGVDLAKFSTMSKNAKTSDLKGMLARLMQMRDEIKD